MKIFLTLLGPLSGHKVTMINIIYCASFTVQCFNKVLLYYLRILEYSNDATAIMLIFQVQFILRFPIPLISGSLLGDLYESGRKEMVGLSQNEICCFHLCRTRNGQKI